MFRLQLYPGHVWTGLVGVIPAMGMMTADQNPPDGPLVLSYGQLVLWSLALAFLGVFCAVPLRTQTILKEKLRFPSGTATANVIRTLHAVPEQRQPPLQNLQSVAVIPEEPGRQCIPVYSKSCTAQVTQLKRRAC